MLNLISRGYQCLQVTEAKVTKSHRYSAELLFVVSGERNTVGAYRFASLIQTLEVLVHNHDVDQPQILNVHPGLDLVLGRSL